MKLKLLYDVKSFSKDDFKELENEDVDIQEYHQKSKEVLIPIILIFGYHFIKNLSSEFGKKIGEKLGEKVGNDCSKIYDKMKTTLTNLLTNKKRFLLVFKEQKKGVDFHLGFDITNPNNIGNVLEELDDLIEKLYDKFKEDKDIIYIGLSFLDEDLKEIYYINNKNEVYTNLSSNALV